MPRLLRPHIPLETRCRVVLRQLGEMWPDQIIEAARPRPGDAYLKGIGGVFVPRIGFTALLAEKLAILADLLDCGVEELHLDHNPALGAREKVFRKGEHVGYKPDANDPEHLIYREAAAHRIKTNVRGEHGQHPDRVLIKRQRRHERGPKPRFRSPVNKSKAKRKWPTRPMQSANRWSKRSKR